MNSKELQILLKELDSTSNFILSTDSLGRQIIDSVLVSNNESEPLRNILIEQATCKMTEYSKNIVEFANRINNTILIWGGILTLLSVMFTFLGLVEVRERLERVVSGIKEIDNKKVEIDRLMIGIKKESDAIDNIQKEVKFRSKILSYTVDLYMIISSQDILDRKIDHLREFYRKVEEITGDCKDVLDLKAKCLLNIAYSLIKKKDFDEAIKSFNEIIKLQPNSFKSYYNRGNFYLETKKLDNALVDFNKAAELKPNEAYLYNNIGNIYVQKMENEKALENYTKSINLNPFPLSYYNRGRLYYNNFNDYEKALIDFKEYLNLDKADIYRCRRDVKQYIKKIGEYKQLNKDSNKT